VKRLTPIIACLVALAATGAPLKLKDIRGPVRQPTAANGQKAAVLFFITVDCPVANRMAPEIKRIAKHFGGSVKFTLVYPDPDLNAAALRKHLDDFGYGKMPAVHDAKHMLVRAAKAEVTPEAVVFDARGRVAYRGRINNLYADFGKPRRVITEHNLREALQSLLEDKTIKQPRTEAIGCFIAPLLK